MSAFAEKICLVIPCFNEGERLNLSEFKNYTDNFTYIFVNDGSTDNTQQVLQGLDEKKMYLLNLRRNVGKAEACRQGVLEALKLHSKNSFSWIGYLDADLSTPIHEIYFMVKYAKLSGNYDVIYGSRVYRMGSKIKRTITRHMLGRLFATLVEGIFKLQSYDTQCGAKLFLPHVAKEAFSLPFNSRWIFDIEILLRLKKHHIVECPLQNWQDIKGSKINLKKDFFLVLRDLWRLKRRYM